VTVDVIHNDDDGDDNGDDDDDDAMIVVLKILSAEQINYLPTSTNRNTLDKASKEDNNDDDIGAVEYI
jgi:hypothetical protein